MLSHENNIKCQYLAEACNYWISKESWRSKGLNINPWIGYKYLRDQSKDWTQELSDFTKYSTTLLKEWLIKYQSFLHIVILCVLFCLNIFHYLYVISPHCCWGLVYTRTLVSESQVSRCFLAVNEKSDHISHNIVGHWCLWHCLCQFFPTPQHVCCRCELQH